MTTPRSSPTPNHEFPAGEPRPDASAGSVDVGVGGNRAFVLKLRSALDTPTLDGLIADLARDEYPDEGVMRRRRERAEMARIELDSTKVQRQALRDWVGNMRAILDNADAEIGKLRAERAISEKEIVSLRERVAKLEDALRGGRIDPDKVTPERIERLVSAARWAAQTLRSHAFSASSLSKAGDDLHSMIGQVAMPFEIPDLDITGGMDSADYVRKMRDEEDGMAREAAKS